MSERRHTDKSTIDPASVWALPDTHPAMLGNRTLFPSTVIEVTKDAPDRLLVSGKNNRKLGKTVEKGWFKGYALYSLSLEERATCPADCSMRAACYGNGMQMARRHRIGDPDVFYDRLGMEVCELLDEHPQGLLVRLHVLGDFPNVEYVANWKDILDENPKVACYGYTRWTRKADVGQAIAAVKAAHPRRFRIRWSSDVPCTDDGALVIDYVPKTPRVKGGVVCPAQTDATACCATCGYCWENSADGVVFIKHGRSSTRLAAEKVMLASAKGGGEAPATRTIMALPSWIGAKFPAVGAPPKTRTVPLTELIIETAYQRDLTPRSIGLIKKIATEWDWTKFKLPVVAETPDGLFVIDGQHTAIAAMTHPGIKDLPVQIVNLDEIERRAASFVAHNRDRLAMSHLQIFHAEAAAGDREAREIIAIAESVGANIPRSQPSAKDYKPGQTVSVSEIRLAYRVNGAKTLRRIFTIGVLAELAPIGRLVTRALRVLLSDPTFRMLSARSDAEIAAAIKSYPNLDDKARQYAKKTELATNEACLALIAKALREKVPSLDKPTQNVAEEATERLRQIEEALKDDSRTPQVWGLTPTEAQILNILARRQIVTKAAIHAVLYGDRADIGPVEKIIDVLVCKIRPKVEPHGIIIETVWGHGYKLTPESRKKITDLQRAGAAA